MAIVVNTTRHPVRPWKLFILGVDKGNVNFKNIPPHIGGVSIVRYFRGAEYDKKGQENTYDACLRTLKEDCDIALFVIGNRYGGNYKGKYFTQKSYWPFNLSITHVEYRLACNKDILPLVYLPIEVNNEYQKWRHSLETVKAITDCHRHRGAKGFCNAVWNTVKVDGVTGVDTRKKSQEEKKAKQMCFLLELSDGLPPDTKYQPFYKDCPFPIGVPVTSKKWSTFLKQALAAREKELLNWVMEKYSDRIQTIPLLLRDMSLKWFRERGALLTPKVIYDGKKNMPFLEAVTTAKNNAKVFILIGEAHTGKTTAMLDTADKLTTRYGSSQGGMVLAVKLLGYLPNTWQDAINHVVRERLERGTFPWSVEAAKEKFLFIDGLDDGQNLDVNKIESFLSGIKTFPGTIVLSARSEWYRCFQTVLHRVLGEIIKLELIQYSSAGLKKVEIAVAEKKVSHRFDFKTPLQAVAMGHLLKSNNGKVQEYQNEFTILNHFIHEHAATVWEQWKGYRDQKGTNMIMDMWSVGIIYAYREAYQDPLGVTARQIVPKLARRYKLRRQESLRIFQAIFSLNDELNAIKGIKQRFYADALASRAVIKAIQSGNHTKLQEALFIPPWYEFQKAIERRIEFAVKNGEAIIANIFESLQKYAQTVSNVSSEAEEAALSSAVFLMGQIADTHPEFKDKGIKALQDLSRAVKPNSFCHIGILFSLMILEDWSAEEILTTTLCKNKVVADRNAKFHLAYHKVVDPSWSFMTGKESIGKCDCSPALDVMLQRLARGKIKDAIRARVYVHLFLNILHKYHNMAPHKEIRRLRETIKGLRKKMSTPSLKAPREIHPLLAEAEKMISTAKSK